MFTTTSTPPGAAPHTGAAAGAAAGAAGAAALVDAVTTIDPYDALSATTDLLVSLRSNIHALHALEATVLAAGHQIAHRIADADGGQDHGEFAHRAVAAELGLAVHESDRAMTIKINHAVTLVTDYPNTHDALLTGRISHPHARTIIDCGTNITNPTQRSSYETIALDIAERETIGRLRPYCVNSRNNTPRNPSMNDTGTRTSSAACMSKNSTTACHNSPRSFPPPSRSVSRTVSTRWRSG
ncbi:DUF222 domain-containing protein [Leucobacter insecticola]|uniref:DUF222 domain-containing protein n=1 Tax=Leucobacter insecticola TaxID=2714934 RepID=A0A6G8FHI9_9MICO|nr:DUF222 domain-containing protein [Leucobacter insecticola]QIM15824.1 DUF222 domain-containing protein [Leucobacter insecticola]